VRTIEELPIHGIDTVGPIRCASWADATTHAATAAAPRHGAATQAHPTPAAVRQGASRTAADTGAEADHGARTRAASAGCVPRHAVITLECNCDPITGIAMGGSTAAAAPNRSGAPLGGGA
jgi:hypothetical protein